MEPVNELVATCLGCGAQWLQVMPGMFAAMASLVLGRKRSNVCPKCGSCTVVFQCLLRGHHADDKTG